MVKTKILVENDNIPKQVEEINRLVEKNFTLQHIRLSQYTRTHVYYMAEPEANRLIVLEVGIESKEVFALVEPTVGWTYVGVMKQD